MKGLSKRRAILASAVCRFDVLPQSIATLNKVSVRRGFRVTLTNTIPLDVYEKCRPCCRRSRQL